MSGVDVAEFVLARLADDEAAARAAYEGNWPNPLYRYWVTEEEDVGKWDEDMSLELIGHANLKADAAHIARHDPARVLRDVEATRRILAEYETATRHGDAEHDPQVWGEIGAFDVTLRLLALRWSEHPDYDPAWSPGA